MAIITDDVCRFLAGIAGELVEYLGGPALDQLGSGSEALFEYVGMGMLNGLCERLYVPVLADRLQCLVGCGWVIRSLRSDADALLTGVWVGVYLDVLVAVIAHGPLVQAQAFLEHEPSVDGQLLDGYRVRLLDGLLNVGELQQPCAADLGAALGHVITVNSPVALRRIPSYRGLTQVEFQELTVAEFHRFSVASLRHVRLSFAF
ncbi:MAG: hypothetical protein OER87_07515 [Gammaproteobacteria bacterium]|nr:hypothetical protein [Gammaproteobacteria bacterium]MDH3535576.1 hypothetical protein [Gammaproteobacteria bacterium]